MRRRWRRARRLSATAAALLLVATAHASQDHLVFRALGWFRGKADITSEGIKCDIPTVTTAIVDGTFAIGLSSTDGHETRIFPDRDNPRANPCGGWLQLRNELVAQGLTLERVTLRLSVRSRRALFRLVPTRNAFPVRCRAMRHATLYLGTHLEAASASTGSSSSGAPNVAFVQLLPLVSADLLQCLRSQYATLPAADFTALPLTIRATADGVADGGSRYRSNSVAYTLELLHLCGNGRVDGGEVCDPTAAPSCDLGRCDGGACTGAPPLACATDADCRGTCVAPGLSAECTCALAAS